MSIVTVTVTRENEQYAYKIVGKGEQYLVLHDDGQNAAEAVLKEVEPVVRIRR